MVVFCLANSEAALLQLLFRAILARDYPQLVGKIVDAHVYTSMSLGGDHQPITQSAEDNARCLGAFRRAKRAIIFNVNVRPRSPLLGDAPELRCAAAAAFSDQLP